MTRDQVADAGTEAHALRAGRGECQADVGVLHRQLRIDEPELLDAALLELSGERCPVEQRLPRADADRDADAHAQRPPRPAIASATSWGRSTGSGCPVSGSTRSSLPATRAAMISPARGGQCWSASPASTTVGTTIAGSSSSSGAALRPAIARHALAYPRGSAVDSRRIFSPSGISSGRLR